MAILILIIVISLLIPTLVILYNLLIRRKNQVINVFGTMDALLKKRFDLVPNLISTVQVYMKHERETLQGLTELRAKAINPNLNEQEKVEMQNRLTKALDGILVAVENYPDLKASQNFMHLQASLNEVEEQISAGRRAYNAAVTDYNNAVEMFPTNIMASVMGYKTKQVFEIPQVERQNVNVKHLFNS
jgi:LemA protein